VDDTRYQGNMVFRILDTISAQNAVSSPRSHRSCVMVCWYRLATDEGYIVVGKRLWI
jgi:hypothetical protein